LVLDEPEAGLDPQSRVLVREYVRSLARQKTIILTTHNMDEADRMADRVAIIDHGKLLVLDTPEALKDTVGEGDVLEVEIGGLAVEVVQRVLARFDAKLLSPLAPLNPSTGSGWYPPNIGGTSWVHKEVTLPPESGGVSGGSEFEKYTLRAPGIGSQIPAILEVIQSAGGQVGEVHLRTNTLEDVFIALTGRGLRQ